MHEKDAWGCGFCACLLSSWEERCEHIALHFEDKVSKWNFTNVILGLLKQSDVAQAWRLLLTEKYGDEQNWPQFTWDSKKSHRLRYKLENKWDARAFDVKKLVLETFELASVEPIEPKPEPLDFNDEQNNHMASAATLPIAMEVDTIESSQTMQQPQWGVSADIPHSDMTTDETLSTYSFVSDFSQPVSQSYHQPVWPNAGFLPSNDMVAFQQPTTQYMDYMAKSVASTAPYDSSPFARAAAPAAHNFINQSTPPNPHSRKWVPKLVNIQHHRDSAPPAPQPQPQEQAPPPPPPKDEHRFSRLLMMRRRPSNISQHAAVNQWNDEYNWG